MKGRFGLWTTLVLFVIALITEGAATFDIHVTSAGVRRAVEIAVLDALVAFAFIMGVRAFFLLFTARTRTSGWMAVIALVAFTMAVLWFPFTIGAVVVGLVAFGAAWKAESKLPPWQWLPEPPPEEK